MRLLRLVLIAPFALVLSTSLALAQAGPLQAGPYAPGHAPVDARPGIGSGQPLRQDSGPASGGAQGLGLDELLLVERGLGQPPYATAGSGPLGTNLCSYDGPTTGPAHDLCLGPNASGGGMIAYGAADGAPPLPFQINVDGASFPFPFPRQGVSGPGQDVPGHLATWGNGLGTLLSDGGAPLSWKIVDPDPTGSKDMTAAIQAACATGRLTLLPAGTYTVTDLACTLGVGQILQGDGDGLTVIHVAAGFNPQAPAVVQMAAVQPAGVVRGISFVFDQPDTAVRASLFTYPPAISVRGAPRARIEHVRCQAATVCIDARGNAGGLVVDDLQSSAFVVSVDLDGSLDTVRLDKLHLWPFGLTGNQLAVLGDGNTFGIRSGRMDDLQVSDFLAYDIGHAIYLFNAPASASSPGGPTIGSASNVDLDDASTFSCQGGGGGFFTMASGYATMGKPNVQAMRVDGCDVSVIGWHFLQAAPSDVPVVQALDTTGEGRLIVGSSSFNLDRNDVTAVSVAQTQSLYADLHDLTFFRIPNIAYNNPTIVAQGQWRGTIHDITGNDKGTGSGTMLYTLTDGWYSIHDIKPVGWAVTVPQNYVDATINLGPGTGIYNYVPGNAPGGYATSADPTRFASLDTSNAPQTIPNQGNLVLRPGAGFLVVNLYSTGEVGLFAVGGGAVALVAQTGKSFVAGAPTAAGQLSVAYARSSNAYYIANATGGQVTVGVAEIWTRQSP